MAGPLKEALSLRELVESDEEAFLIGLKEWDGEDLSWYTFDWKPGMSFREHILKLKNSREGIGLAEGWVPSTMFYGFVDGQIVGRVSVRHRLTPTLLRRGGHMGYSVAPRFRGQGFASEMVRQSLPYLRQLGIKKALVTCADDNIGSRKIIERLGGQLENEIRDDEEDEMIRRYWVECG